MAKRLKTKIAACGGDGNRCGKAVTLAAEKGDYYCRE